MRIETRILIEEQCDHTRGDRSRLRRSAPDPETVGHHGFRVLEIGLPEHGEVGAFGEVLAQQSVDRHHPGIDQSDFDTGTGVSVLPQVASAGMLGHFIEGSRTRLRTNTGQSR